MSAKTKKAWMFCIANHHKFNTLCDFPKLTFFSLAGTFCYPLRNVSLFRVLTDSDNPCRAFSPDGIEYTSFLNSTESENDII